MAEFVATKNTHIQTYAYGDYRVDICADGEVPGVKEAWLYHKDYCMKRFMYGMHVNMEDFVAMVKAELDNEIQFYEEDLKIIEEGRR